MTARHCHWAWPCAGEAERQMTADSSVLCIFQVRQQPGQQGQGELGNKQDNERLTAPSSPARGLLGNRAEGPVAKGGSSGLATLASFLPITVSPSGHRTQVIHPGLTETERGSPLSEQLVIYPCTLWKETRQRRQLAKKTPQIKRKINSLRKGYGRGKGKKYFYFILLTFC